MKSRLVSGELQTYAGHCGGKPWVARDRVRVEGGTGHEGGLQR